MSPRPAEGARLGPYELLVCIGRGGMGEVWKARDTRLDREVAVKRSAEQFTDRFEREAKAIAALNHPNICTLFDVGPNYLVMELIDGPTLADRISEGPIPLEESLAIARQIAEALEAAHEKNIVHRDLKPGNIKVRPDGSVKVLDFGLAKSGLSGAEVTHDSPTLMHSPTMVGVILGTAAYMAPEQARGKVVDKRADIWAFGVVLHEMLTGKRTFEGEDLTETLASVVKSDPDLTIVPRNVRRLLRKCLQKDPKKRLRDIGDAWDYLDDSSTPATAQLPSRLSMWRSRMGWVTAGVFALIAAGVAIHDWRRAEPAGAGSTAHLTMEIAPAEAFGNREFNADRPSHTAIAISPDGNTVVFSAHQGPVLQLYRRNLNQTAVTPIPGTEGAILPFFSPDGKWIAFLSDSKLKKVPLAGGPVATIADARGVRGVGASWGTADNIVFAPRAGDLKQVPAGGGPPQTVLKPGASEIFLTPGYLPDGKTILFTVRNSADWQEARIVALRPGETKPITLIKGGTDARYVPTGHLVYMQNAVLMAVPFDAVKLKLTGAPVAMLDGVMQAVNEPNGNAETGSGQFAISPSGSLAYASGGIYPPRLETLVSVDRKGAQTEINVPKGSYVGPRLSPDGQKIAVFKELPASRQSDIWVLDASRGTTTRLTSQDDADWPVWSADGKSIFFAHRGASGLFEVAADGSGAVAVLASGPIAVPSSISPDGKLLAWLQGPDRREIVTRASSGGGEPKTFLSSPQFTYTHAEFSPDGRWMAYCSNESGTEEVYVQAFPGPGDRHVISTGGGSGPMWSRNGRELFYSGRAPREGGKTKFMAVDVTLGASFKSGAPRILFEGTWANSTPSRSYDVMPDSQHFIMLQPESIPDQRVTKLDVVLNWFDELRKRVPAAKAN